MAINEQWLLNSIEDPWQLVSDNINLNTPYAFIGNGYIGQQIPPEGEGMLFPQENYSRSGCLIHGLYSEQPLNRGILDFVKQHSPPGSPLIQESLAEAPLWNTLCYFDGNKSLARNIGCHTNYQQYLDLKTATVTTTDTWSSSSNKTTAIKTSVYLSYFNRNLAVITTTITPNFTDEISFEDSLDASFIDNLNNCQTKANDIMVLSLNLGSHHHQITIASKLIIPPNIKVKTEYQKNKNKIIRKIYFKTKPKHSYTITKLVGIYTYQDGNNLITKAKTMLNKAAQNLTKERKTHEQKWQKLWQHHIEISGAPGLQKLINATLYQFYCQLREGIHCSLSPTGISGCQQWAGIIFWDADLWMGPPLALLNPKLARSIFEYRYKTLAGAKQNALAEGYQGAQFAWESTESGIETCYAYTAKQPHTTSDIALTQWQYYLISNDQDYFAKAAKIILECAQYWETRITYNKQKNYYEIKQVCCADEYSGIVDNNTYTNYSAIKTLQIASKILKQKTPAKWSEIIEKMYLPFDKDKNLYLEHENYQGEAIKQADTALLIYPYQMPMTDEQQHNIVEYYRSKYPQEKIMMSSAFDGIIYCEQQKPEKAWHALLDLLPHFSTPFLSVSESPTNNVASFMTGLGGLLQLIINGFCGLRIDDDELKFNPCLPKHIKKITLKGIHYHGECFDVLINANCLRKQSCNS